MNQVEWVTALALQASVEDMFALAHRSVWVSICPSLCFLEDLKVTITLKSG